MSARPSDDSQSWAFDSGHTGKDRRRRALTILAVTAVVAVAVGGPLLYLYTAPASLAVSTTTPFVGAASPVRFDAIISTPPAVDAGPVSWQFGDGERIEATTRNTNHTYRLPGAFLVAASAPLSNGASIDNFHGLFPMQVGPQPVPPRPFGSTASLGVLAINRSASSQGAPLISPPGTIQIEGSVGQAPTFFYSMEPFPSNNTWVNFSWQPIELKLDFGDGSPPRTTTDVTAPFAAAHVYGSQGIYAITLKVTTANFSAWQYNGLPENPVATMVTPVQLQTTVVGQSVAVGDYRLITYAGSVVNPGTIVDMRVGSGAYFTLDPAIEYFGDLAIPNIYESLLAYNGSRTDSFLPVVADSIPTRANGDVSSDYLSYTFHIRQGRRFSDNATVTPWDVKYSFTRTLLFTYGSPATPGWLLAQYVLPMSPDGTWNLSFGAVNRAISVDNVSGTVTFHLVRPGLPLAIYQIFASLYGYWIVSRSWLEEVGPRLDWSDAGFRAYRKYGSLPEYVSAWRNGAVGSGPYMIDYTANPDALVLKANPAFTPVPGSPRPSVGRVVVQFVQEQDASILSLESGQADIASISPTRFGNALALQRAGLTRILFAPTLNLDWWGFNMEIYQSNVGANENLFGNHVPPDFFVDVNMRKAFFHAFDFDQYLDDILGNRRYNATFGTKYNGVIPAGMIGYQDLSTTDVFDLPVARNYYNQTQWVKDRGWANSGFTLAITVQPDPILEAAAAAWAANLETLGPGITINVEAAFPAVLLATAVPHKDPIAIGGFGWTPDYPLPTAYTKVVLLPGTSASPYGGFFPAVTSFNVSYFANDKNGTNQATNITKILDWIEDSIGANETDLNRVVEDSRLAQEMAVNLTTMVPLQQENSFFTFRTWIGGMEQETNPVLGVWNILYDRLTKESLASGAELGPRPEIAASWLAWVRPGSDLLMASSPEDSFPLGIGQDS